VSSQFDTLFASMATPQLGTHLGTAGWGYADAAGTDHGSHTVVVGERTTRRGEDERGRHQVGRLTIAVPLEGSGLPWLTDPHYRGGVWTDPNDQQWAVEEVEHCSASRVYLLLAATGGEQRTRADYHMSRITQLEQ